MDKQINRRAIDKETIDEVHQLMAAIIGEDHDEMAHMKRVVEHALKLSKKRQLDPSLAEMAAMLHDVGRWISSEEAGGHGKKGARIAARFLEPYQLAKEHAGTIEDAIRNHTKKDRIDDDYSELIKDADALAHEAEGVDLTDKPMEAFRIKSLKMHSFGFRIKGGVDLEAIVETQQLRIRQLLSDILDEGVLSQERAHELRVEARNYGALMNSTEIPEALEQLFKKAGKARNIRILINAVAKSGASERLFGILEEQESKALGKAFKELVEVLAGIESIRPDMYELESLMEMTPEALRLEYHNVLNGVDMADSDKLHMLRIHGKRYRGLLKLGIIETLESDDVLLLDDLHDILGKLQDIASSKKLLKKLSKHKDIQNKEIEAFRRWAEKRHKELMGKVLVTITMIRIRAK